MGMSDSMHFKSRTHFNESLTITAIVFYAQNMRLIVQSYKSIDNIRRIYFLSENLINMFGISFVLKKQEQLFSNL